MGIGGYGKRCEAHRIARQSTAGENAYHRGVSAGEVMRKTMSEGGRNEVNKYECRDCEFWYGWKSYGSSSGHLSHCTNKQQIKYSKDNYVGRYVWDTACESFSINSRSKKKEAR